MSNSQRLKPLFSPSKLVMIEYSWEYPKEISKRAIHSRSIGLTVAWAIALTSFGGSIYPTLIFLLSHRQRKKMKDLPDIQVLSKPMAFESKSEFEQQQATPPSLYPSSS
ncbi:hypothetical protein CEXT_291611 [Caerostris extrusa]|uniref:Uncharacterized protein n=1 Tax=Caerostris extrusa TaxID=172846 RepID=A0AAV4W5E5_CAEEX|nr:hypothetical protein CEXT_291611 [Caerostris extrusa]